MSKWQQPALQFLRGRPFSARERAASMARLRAAHPGVFAAVQVNLQTVEDQSGVAADDFLDPEWDANDAYSEAYERKPARPDRTETERNGD